MPKIGFTGTRRGMTTSQMSMLNVLLKDADEFHHGDCVGSDEQAAGLAKAKKITVVRHPPDNDKYRAYAESDVSLAPKPYIKRNHEIVNSTDELIATPREFNDVLRSGTWATIRYAIKQMKPVTVVLPDGSIQIHNRKY